jgi:hypothetical protein
MSLSKRILFGNDPRDQAARDRMRSATSDYLREFPYRLPMKRKASSGPRYWDNFWPLSVSMAVRELGYDVIQVNGGLFAREREHIEAIKTRAEAIRLGLGGGVKP